MGDSFGDQSDIPVKTAPSNILNSQNCNSGDTSSNTGQLVPSSLHESYKPESLTFSGEGEFQNAFARTEVKASFINETVIEESEGIEDNLGEIQSPFSFHEIQNPTGSEFTEENRLQSVREPEVNRLEESFSESNSSSSTKKLITPPPVTRRSKGGAQTVFHTRSESIVTFEDVIDPDPNTDVNEERIIQHYLYGANEKSVNESSPSLPTTGTGRAPQNTTPLNSSVPVKIRDVKASTMASVKGKIPISTMNVSELAIPNNSSFQVNRGQKHGSPLNSSFVPDDGDEFPLPDNHMNSKVFENPSNSKIGNHGENLNSKVQMNDTLQNIFESKELNNPVVDEG